MSGTGVPISMLRPASGSLLPSGVALTKKRSSAVSAAMSAPSMMPSGGSSAAPLESGRTMPSSRPAVELLRISTLNIGIVPAAVWSVRSRPLPAALMATVTSAAGVASSIASTMSWIVVSPLSKATRKLLPSRNLISRSSLLPEPATMPSSLAAVAPVTFLTSMADPSSVLKVSAPFEKPTLTRGFRIGSSCAWIWLTIVNG